ncbi:DUF1801 domain-containing protein [Aquiflexum gelatinilyticum]|uniref:DUF1801 domain-containing protein n=1 Tax=Aquiflexum gelatinilyticum TaxID=2961943 RepID=A0A9X2T0G3_9BACT|nr:DUF1801 domain-containing protein [Aquiflexum gelatinilyticum]MCR9014871.1 DUF1801 domain-containing protein [Aquiflexum gelatinilyticum]
MKTESSNPVLIYLDQLDHPLKPEILKIREIIFSANPDLTEHIKWNAPSFCLEGEDKITYNLSPKKDSIQLVLHRGAKKRDLPKEKLINEDSGLLKWAANDRAVIRFTSMQEILEDETKIQEIIQKWLEVA